jgi:predicted dienelactone hydrolase
MDFDLKDLGREGRNVPIRVYHDGTKNKYPVILFSHGLGGSRSNNPYLGKFWADHGYTAVFMQHPGSDIDVIKNARFGQRFRVLRSAASWKSASDRVADVSFVLDRLEKFSADKFHPLFGKLDLDNVGMAGHSFGAVTTLSVAGRKFALTRKFVDERRIDAFLSMSPQPEKGIDPATAFGHLNRPIFCMTGTKDGSPIDKSFAPETRQLVYKALPAGDKFQLVLDGAEHHAFGDIARRGQVRDPDHHGIIQALSLKFWDAYLKGDADAKAYLQSKSAESVKGFKSSDSYVWK